MVDDEVYGLDEAVRDNFNALLTNRLVGGAGNSPGLTDYEIFPKPVREYVMSRIQDKTAERQFLCGADRISATYFSFFFGKKLYEEMPPEARAMVDNLGRELIITTGSCVSLLGVLAINYGIDSGRLNCFGWAVSSCEKDRKEAEDAAAFSRQKFNSHVPTDDQIIFTKG
ncbi:hypothetical protein KA107_03560 [Candidatus Pacearchaeota archaeon]|nr:hypothetical protein [Candidatus Pacearchaeota archaeon]